MYNYLSNDSYIIDVAAMFEHPATRPLHIGGVMMKAIICGIYSIVNTCNGHRYIGSSKDILRRFQDHKSGLNRGNHRNAPLQRAWNKYGATSFEFVIVELCGLSSLIAREQFYLNRLTHDDYNTSKNADTPMRGVAFSDEHRQRLSESHKGQTMSLENRQKMSERLKGHKFNLGRKHTDEHNKKIGLKSKGNKYRLGVRLSEELKKRLSEIKKGIMPKNLGKSFSHKGRKHTEEARRKISESHKGKPPANKGKPHSEEHRRKLREAWARRKAKNANE